MTTLENVAHQRVEAYLDIETTGLSPTYDEITVVGIHLCSETDTKFIQLVGRDVTADNILEALKGISVIYTYNGKAFDLPFIHSYLGINLASLFAHHDLMYDCWRNNLYGGFKAVERQLGIHRHLTEVNGYEAVKLWWRYADYFDLDALDTLLEYNKEDVINLKTLKEMLFQPSSKTRQKEVTNVRRILIIEDGKPTLLDETEFTEEGKLQDYIEEYPTVIPLSEIIEGASDLLCIGREVGAGSGSIDLLFIDKEGLLTIVETKLRRNREVRREVIGQIIEYASYVSQWTADDVYRIANEYFLKSDKVSSERKGVTLDIVMEKIVGDEFSDEDFRYQIGQNLRDGRLRLIIAVDKLIEELRATVTFLNSSSKFDILLLQVSNFEESESKKALVPLLFGYKPPSPLGQGIRVQSTKENFFKDAKNRCREDIVRAMEDLYKFSEDKATFIGWGTGAARRSFIFHGVRKWLSFFTLYSDGAIANNVGSTAAWQALDTGTLMDFWISELNRRLEINISREEGSIVNMGDLVQRNKLEEFKDAVLALCQKIES